MKNRFVRGFVWLQVAARCFSFVLIVIEGNVIAVMIADDDLALNKSARPAIDIRKVLKGALVIEIANVRIGNARPWPPRHRFQKA